MQTLPCASLKNNYLYLILITLADMQTRVYNFTIKRVRRGFNISTKTNKRSIVPLPIPYIGPSFS